MSMLSSQCDELRQVAQVYRNLGKHATEQMLLDAADTILELRDDLQRANADNDRLREEIAKARDPQRIGGQADPESFVYAIEQLREFRWQHATNDEDAIPYINKVAEAHERENAKLRELLRAAYRCTNAGPNCLDCRIVAGGCTLLSAMRKLGIEVD